MRRIGLFHESAKAIRRRVSQLLGANHLMLRRSLANRLGMLCNQVFCGSLTVFLWCFDVSSVVDELDLIPVRPF